MTHPVAKDARHTIRLIEIRKNNSISQPRNVDCAKNVAFPVLFSTIDEREEAE